MAGQLFRACQKLLRYHHLTGMIANTLSSNLHDRIQGHAREWNLKVEEVFETESSAIAFVSRSGEPLVLKVIKQQGDEWHAGEILEAFAGRGVARLYEHAGGAMLVERLTPGNSLVRLSLEDQDEEATEILAEVIQKMSAPEAPKRCATTQAWAKGFERYLATADKQIPRSLVGSAQQVYIDLCASQSAIRLLHGDLHHYNVLFDSNRGWVAIDPKGVVGELEYEIRAVLRNPSVLFALTPNDRTTAQAVHAYIGPGFRTSSVVGICAERALGYLGD